MAPYSSVSNPAASTRALLAIEVPEPANLTHEINQSRHPRR
jgi:hypothetical protein